MCYESDKKHQIRGVEEEKCETYNWYVECFFDKDNEVLGEILSDSTYLNQEFHQYGSAVQIPVREKLESSHLHSH